MTGEKDRGTHTKKDGQIENKEKADKNLNSTTSILKVKWRVNTPKEKAGTVRRS